MDFEKFFNNKKRSSFKTLLLSGVFTFNSYAMAQNPILTEVDREDAKIEMTSDIAKSDEAKRNNEKKLIIGSLKNLSKIEMMKDVLDNLPEGLKYEFSDYTPGVASYGANENIITLKPEKAVFDNKQDSLEFYVSLAHELKHANQKKEGLYYDDLKGAKFGDTFRVAKLMEIEARLFSVMLENELLKKDEYKECLASPNCFIYQMKLDESKGNVKEANKNFVLTYWQNSKNDAEMVEPMRNIVNLDYFFYAEQAYHHALLQHNPLFEQVSSERNVPIDVAEKYAQRMGLDKSMGAEFLKNGFDNVIVDDDYSNGIVILHHDGSKYMDLKPTNDVCFDMVTFYKDNEPDGMFIRNGITKEMKPFDDILPFIEGPEIESVEVLDKMKVDSVVPFDEMKVEHERPKLHIRDTLEETNSVDQKIIGPEHSRVSIDTVDDKINMLVSLCSDIVRESRMSYKELLNRIESKMIEIHEVPREKKVSKNDINHQLNVVDFIRTIRAIDR